MFLLDFVALFLASGAVVNAWVHKDGLFEKARRRLRALGRLKQRKRPRTVGTALVILLTQLLNCRFCLNYHAPIWLLVLFYLPSFFMPDPLAVIWYLPVYALAAARLSLLIGSLTASLPIEGDPEND